MKIRNGFVSNSSSSSFVCALDHKPTSYLDLHSMMFGNGNGRISIYDDSLSYAEISSILYNDLEKDGFVEANLEGIAKEFSSRYNYYPQQNIIWAGRQNDEDGGAWGERLSQYYGSNKKIMDEIKELTIQEEKLSKEYYAKRNELIHKNCGKQPPYASEGGLDNTTKKPYTKAQITKYNDYMEKVSDYGKNDPEMRKFVDDNWEKRDKLWKALRKLQDKMGKEDAKNFLKDHKDKFVFIVNYADDTVNGRVMEHGGVFDKINHVRINHH